MRRIRWLVVLALIGCGGNSPLGLTEEIPLTAPKLTVQKITEQTVQLSWTAARGEAPIYENLDRVDCALAGCCFFTRVVNSLFC